MQGGDFDSRAVLRPEHEALITRSDILALLLSLLCFANQASAADTWIVREDGVGPTKIGMSLAQLSAVLHEKFSPPADKEDQGCFYVNPSKHPQIAFMIENGRLVRVDVDREGLSTSEGIQVGDSESHALKVYGHLLKVEPRAFMEEEGHFLTASSRDGRFGVRFETDHGKITGFYAGRYKAIQYIEGCE